jgi:hypothetical protein
MSNILGVVMNKPNLNKPIADFIENSRKRCGKPIYELTPQEPEMFCWKCRKMKAIRLRPRLMKLQYRWSTAGNAGFYC